MSDFVNSFEKVLILQYNNGMLAKKLATRFPVLQSFNTKHFFFRNLYQNERIQQIPVDLDILGHFVPSYTTLHYTEDSNQTGRLGPT